MDPMEFEWKGVIYTICYHVVDYAEHMYDIWLMDDEGNEFNPDNMEGLSQQMFYRVVEREATATFESQRYDDYKDREKYGGR